MPSLLGLDPCRLGPTLVYLALTLIHPLFTWLYVRGMPDDDDATGQPVADACSNWFGKLMQHPERDTNHWLISTMGRAPLVCLTQCLCERCDVRLLS